METYEQIVQYEDERSRRRRRRKEVAEDAASTEEALPWDIAPCEVHADMRSVCNGLLMKSKRLRLGARSLTADSLRQHRFFQDIDWEQVSQQTCAEVPHVPDLFDIDVFAEEIVPLGERTAQQSQESEKDMSRWEPEGFTRL